MGTTPSRKTRGTPPASQPQSGMSGPRGPDTSAPSVSVDLQLSEVVFFLQAEVLGQLLDRLPVSESLGQLHHQRRTADQPQDAPDRMATDESSSEQERGAEDQGLGHAAADLSPLRRRHVRPELPDPLVEPGLDLLDQTLRLRPDRPADHGTTVPGAARRKRCVPQGQPTRSRHLRGCAAPRIRSAHLPAGPWPSGWPRWPSSRWSLGGRWPPRRPRPSDPSSRTTRRTKGNADAARGRSRAWSPSNSSSTRPTPTAPGSTSAGRARKKGRASTRKDGPWTGRGTPPSPPSERPSETCSRGSSPQTATVTTTPWPAAWASCTSCGTAGSGRPGRAGGRHTAFSGGGGARTRSRGRSSTRIPTTCTSASAGPAPGC